MKPSNQNSLTEVSESPMFGTKLATRAEEGGKMRESWKYQENQELAPLDSLIKTKMGVMSLRKIEPKGGGGAGQKNLGERRYNGHR